MILLTVQIRDLKVGLWAKSSRQRAAEVAADEAGDPANDDLAAIASSMDSAEAASAIADMEDTAGDAAPAAEPPSALALLDPSPAPSLPFTARTTACTGSR